MANWLRSEILRGALPPGTQLQQDEVAKRLGLSPTPVREAFSLLIAEGLLVGRPHRGVVIAPAYAGESHEIYAVRAFVEGMAASRAAQELSASAQAELEALNGRMGAAVKREDLYAFRRASARFHEVIGEASGSRVLAELTKTLMSRVQSVPLDRRRMTKLHQEHVQLLDLLKTGDSDEAALVMRKHVEVSVTPLKPERSASSRATRRRRKT